MRTCEANQSVPRYLSPRGRAGLRAWQLRAGLAVACLIQLCASGQHNAAPMPLQLRVTRQAQATDEAGNAFAKVFVASNTALRQESLDSMVVAGETPELVFTDQAQQDLFQSWKTQSFPVELHVDSRARHDVASSAAGPNGDGDMADEGNDQAYIESYGEIGVHALMLQDAARCAWYEAELMRVCTHVKEAVVLDVGCGTGLLSLFAARAGAKKVYAVESNARMASLARRIVSDNGLSSVIEVLHARVEDVVLPVAHVDVIVSEWMGFYLLHESMLDSVLSARDRFLKVRTAPDRCVCVCECVCVCVCVTMQGPDSAWLLAQGGLRSDDPGPCDAICRTCTPARSVARQSRLLDQLSANIWIQLLWGSYARCSGRECTASDSGRGSDGHARSRGNGLAG